MENKVNKDRLSPDPVLKPEKKKNYHCAAVSKAIAHPSSESESGEAWISGEQRR